MTGRRLACALGLSLCAAVQVRAQPPRESGPAPPPLTLDQAIEFAGAHYPSVGAALEQIAQSAAGVDVARSAILPRLDSLWQSNRGTANNIFGQVLPQSVVPSMSGPVLASTSLVSVWGSAAGALFSWEAIDFGLRRAQVAGAQAALAAARAGATLTRLDAQHAAASAYLDILAAQRTLAAAEADVERRNVLLRSVQVLVENQLRPGADQSRAEAERAAAQTRAIRSRQTLAIAQATLARLLGRAADAVTIAGEALLDRVPASDIPAAAAAHPLEQVRQAAVDQAKAQERVLAQTDLPRVLVQSSVFARGSGAHPDGTFDTGAGGLGLSRTNWAAGVEIVFPNLFDFASLHARKAAAAAATRASAALHEEAVLQVTSNRRTAAALLESARAVAAVTPVQLAAAQQSERQARARYDAGLATVLEVADAQNALAQAEVQDQLARVDIWRALLAAAVARGDVAPLLDILRRP